MGPSPVKQTNEHEKIIQKPQESIETTSHKKIFKKSSLMTRENKKEIPEKHIKEENSKETIKTIQKTGNNKTKITNNHMTKKESKNEFEENKYMAKTKKNSNYNIKKEKVIKTAKESKID